MYHSIKMPMPVCTAHPDIDEKNLGWTMGVLEDGVPFVAELWQMDGEQSMTVVIPFQKALLPDWQGIVVAVGTAPDREDIGKGCYIAHSASVLTTGMRRLDDFTTGEQIIAHVNYLCDAGLIAFTDVYRNGGIQILGDMAGRPVVAVHIMLEADGTVVAKTPLRFEAFSRYKGKGAM